MRLKSKGEIPKGMFRDLTQLRIVDLEYNQLSGNISSILKFNNSLLQELHLSYNNFSGNLPSNICHGLPNLRVFDLYHNDISGNMPTLWHQCEEMEQLRLSFNGFNKGPMPGDIQNMTKLQQLYLSDNNMEDEILAKRLL
ncbi:LRR receptor-like kinase family protein [Medicago truncatula]|uniref:LRR receptor-like kinase family protein n=1 Tax=Medicago truncatula TaxID=3880 RepID=A0A072U2C0_MEDTR|nr:LRR receptor-like kinase family protein [Medicago truncatula]